MTNKEAIDRLNGMQGRCENGWDAEAIYLAIKALEGRPTLRHVIINHPRYGKSDAWYDEARQIVFQHWVSKEYANTLGWKIEEEEE